MQNTRASVGRPWNVSTWVALRESAEVCNSPLQSRAQARLKRSSGRQRERHWPKTPPRSSWRSSTRSRPRPRPNRPQTRCDWAETGGETLRRDLRSISPSRWWPSGHNWKTAETDSEKKKNDQKPFLHVLSSLFWSSECNSVPFLWAQFLLTVTFVSDRTSRSPHHFSPHTAFPTGTIVDAQKAAVTWLLLAARLV